MTTATFCVARTGFVEDTHLRSAYGSPAPRTQLKRSVNPSPLEGAHVLLLRCGMSAQLQRNPACRAAVHARHAFHTRKENARPPGRALRKLNLSSVNDSLSEYRCDTRRLFHHLIEVDAWPEALREQ